MCFLSRKEDHESSDNGFSKKETEKSTIYTPGETVTSYSGPVSQESGAVKTDYELSGYQSKLFSLDSTGLN